VLGGARPTTEDASRGEQAPVRAAPGDEVVVLPLGGGYGVVEEILPRRSVLERAAGEGGGAQVMLANLDHAVLVFAVRDPAPHLGMLDRYLALCEHAGIEPTICLNKVDLGVPAEVSQAAELYRSLGYRVAETSAVNGEDLAALARCLDGRVSLMTGPSGVGKSSLINRLLPDARLRTGAISEATGKGRHTTTGVRLLRLGDGGWLADSAGIRELALWNVPPEELARCFVELRAVADDCTYENCDHGALEEGCALRLALARGGISPARFASFERLLREARGEVA
jgi:ribosome biogenesis GTPase